MFSSGDTCVGDVQLLAVAQMAFLLEAPRSFDVDAATGDTKILSLSERAVRTMIEEDATVAAKLLMHISKMLCVKLIALERVASGRCSGNAGESRALCGMTTLGNYNTDVSDMYAVHKALIGALDAAPAYVAKADLDSQRVEVIGSFYENVIEFLHVHHTGEDELIYPVLEQRCAESRSELERINDQHKLLHAPMDAGRSAIASLAGGTLDRQRPSGH